MTQALPVELRFAAPHSVTNTVDQALPGTCVAKGTRTLMSD